MTTILGTDSILGAIPRVRGYPVLGPCALFARLGAGGMGAVYRARHLNLGIDVAVKVMKPELIADRNAGDEAVRRFRNEAMVSARLREHRNVVSVLDAGQQHGLHYIVMDFVEGWTLADLVARRGPLPAAEALTIMRQAGAGVAAAHELGIVHRDIKPGNLMVSRKGVVKVLDLGLARALESEGATCTRGIMGTPEFMAPEQYADTHGVGPAADVWALGLTHWFLLAGTSPFRSGGDFVATMAKVVHAELPDLAVVRGDVPPDVVALIGACARKAPAERPPDARALLADLRACAPREDCPLGEPLPSTEAQEPEWPSRSEAIRIRDALAAAAKDDAVPITIPDPVPRKRGLALRTAAALLVLGAAGAGAVASGLWPSDPWPECRDRGRALLAQERYEECLAAVKDFLARHDEDRARRFIDEEVRPPYERAFEGGLALVAPEGGTCRPGPVAVELRSRIPVAEMRVAGSAAIAAGERFRCERLVKATEDVVVEAVTPDGIRVRRTFRLAASPWRFEEVVAVDGPAEGEVLSVPEATVRGRILDARFDVEVAGRGVTCDPERRFAAPVALVEGSNRILLAATLPGLPAIERPLTVIYRPAEREGGPPDPSRPPPDAETPRLEILALVVPEGPVRAEEVAITGRVSDPSAAVAVDGASVAVDAGGGFRAVLALAREGANDFVLEVRRGAAATTRPVQVVRDTRGPSLRVLEPDAVDVLQALVIGSSLRLGVVAEDPAGIAEVLVNGKGVAAARPDAGGLIAVPLDLRAMTGERGTATLEIRDGLGNGAQATVDVPLTGLVRCEDVDRRSVVVFPAARRDTGERVPKEISVTPYRDPHNVVRRCSIDALADSARFHCIRFLGGALPAGCVVPAARIDPIIARVIGDEGLGGAFRNEQAVRLARQVGAGALVTILITKLDEGPVRPPQIQVLAALEVHVFETAGGREIGDGFLLEDHTARPRGTYRDVAPGALERLFDPKAEPDAREAFVRAVLGALGP